MKKKLKVEMNWVRYLAQERDKINKVKFEDIEWYENGLKVELTKEEIDTFSFVGLNNTDYVTHFKEGRVSVLKFQTEIDVSKNDIAKEWMTLNPECGCRECNPNYRLFLVCEICGNKRCPKAENHIYKCTNSNDTNQVKELETNK